MGPRAVANEHLGRVPLLAVDLRLDNLHIRDVAVREPTLLAGHRILTLDELRLDAGGTQPQVGVELKGLAARRVLLIAAVAAAGIDDSTSLVDEHQRGPKVLLVLINQT